jgi:hypothetical protein
MEITHPVGLDADGWDELTTARWDEDRKMAHLRTLWVRVIDSAEAVAASRAA